MIKRAITIILLLAATHSYSQTSSTASQTLRLKLTPVIQINTVTSEDVNIGFSTVSDYSSGVQSSNQEFKVSSNQKYVVSVKANASNFAYTGSTLPAPSMPISILQLGLASNNTGGEVPSLLMSNYMTLSTTPTNILLNCDNGANKTFSISYKANPGNDYPAGIYTVGIVYTATQP